MQRYVEKLREQPSDVRSHAAFVGALVVTALVAVVWLGTLPGRLGTTSVVAVENPVEHKGMFAGMKDTLANAFTAGSAWDKDDEAIDAESAEKKLDLDAAQQAGAVSNANKGKVEVVEPEKILIETTTTDTN